MAWSGPSRWVLRSALLLALCPLSPTTRAAGFDCRHARTATEHAICGDAALSVSDEVMSAAYALVLSGGRDRVANEQRAWLQRRNACGPDVACIRSSYQERLKQLDLEKSPALAESLAVVRCDGRSETVVITPAPNGSTAEPDEQKLLRVPPRATLTWVLSPEHRHLDCQFDSGRVVRVKTGDPERYPYGRCGAAQDTVFSVWVDGAKWVSRAALATNCDTWPWQQVKTEVRREAFRTCQINAGEGQARCDDLHAPASEAARDLDEYPDGPGDAHLPLYSQVIEHAADPALCKSMVTRAYPGPRRPYWMIELPAAAVPLPWVEPGGPRPPVTLVSRFDLDNDGREETVVSVHYEGRARESSTYLVQRDTAAEAASAPFAPSFLKQHTARAVPHAWAQCRIEWGTDAEGVWDDGSCSVPLANYRPRGLPYAFDIRLLQLRPFRHAGRTYFLGLVRSDRYPKVVWLPAPDGTAQEICVFRQVLKNL